MFGTAVPTLIPVTAHGSEVGTRSSILRTVLPASPVSGAYETPAARMSASVILGRTNIWVNGIALPSLAYCHRYDVALFCPVIALPPNDQPATKLWIDSPYDVTRRVSFATCVFAVVFVWKFEFDKVVVVLSNLIELSGMPPPIAHDHVPKFRTFIRTSCQVVPAMFVARRRRRPSGRLSMRAPLRRPSTIGVERVAGAKAPVPVTVVRTVDGDPWPQYGNVQPSRPRPISTQPPPSVVMSQ